MQSLVITPATPSDIPSLTALEKRTFDDDSQKYLNQPVGGPPGYDAEAWNMAMLHRAYYLKIMLVQAETSETLQTPDINEALEILVGGMIVFDMGHGHFELGRIWIDPDYQSQGLGGQALVHLEKAFPQATRWTLDTPIWATRNHYFYAKHGYRMVRQDIAVGTVYFEKRIPTPSPSPKH